MIFRDCYGLGGLLLAATMWVHSTAEAARVPMFFNGAWQADIRYRKGDIVIYNNTLYQTLKRNAGIKPDADNRRWQVVLATASGGGTSTGRNCASPTMGGNLAGCDLSGGANPLRDLKLSGINLAHAILDGDIGNVDLTGANLRGAVLGLTYTDGSRVSLTLGSNAVLNYADLTGVTSGSGNTPLIANSVSFKGASLAAASVPSAKLRGADLSLSTLDGIDLSGADLSGVIAVNARIGNGNLYAIDLSGANLESATLERTVLDGAKLIAANLSRANLRGAALGGADLTGAYLGSADLTGALYGDTAIVGTDPTTGQTTEFEGAICPDGVKVDGLVATTCVGHGIGP